MNLFLLDRRKNRRIPFPVRAKLNLHGKICRGRGKNISLTGATLRVEDPPSLSVGQSLQLYLGNESFYFNVAGTVRGIQELASCPADHPALPIVNVAIQFTNFSRREQQVLDSLIEGYQDRAVSLQVEVKSGKSEFYFLGTTPCSFNQTLGPIPRANSELGWTSISQNITPDQLLLPINI